MEACRDIPTNRIIRKW